MIVNERDNQPVFIGYVGENNSRPVPFYVGDIIEKYPNATFSLIHKRQGDEDGYPVNSAYWDVEEKILTWRPQSGDLAAEGIGELQIKASNDGDIIKTKVYKTDTHGALGESADPPSPWESWLEQFEDEAAEAAEAAEDAEAYAIGKRDGTDVEVTDPAYHNNSKYYSEQAAGSATTAGSAASAAAGSASAAQAAVNNFAPDYSALTFPIAEGTLCAHSGGYYVANQDISTSEEWTAAHWTATNIGTQLAAVKSAINGLEDNSVQYVLQRTITVGSNLITGDTPASGTGWSGSFANGFTHSSGNTDPLVFSVNTTENKVYVIQFDWTSNLQGGISVGIGDSPLADAYNGTEHAFIGFIADGGYLKLYPVSNFTGTITNIQLRQETESGTEVTQNCMNVTNGENTSEISGFYNVSIGPYAMQKNQNGTRNIAIGCDAMQRLVSGNRNIAIGTFAMPFVSEGENNIAIGADTIYNPSMSTGDIKANSNIAIGKSALRSGTLVQNNIAVGRAAMSESSTTGEENVAIGVQAGYNTGNGGTYIGYRAGYYWTLNYNVCIGDDAGFAAYHNGQNNIFIGAKARPNVPGASSSTPKTCSNSIVIGYDTVCKKSKAIVIGKSSHEYVELAGKELHFNEDGTVTWTTPT